VVQDTVSALDWQSEKAVRNPRPVRYTENSVVSYECEAYSADIMAVVFFFHVFNLFCLGAEPLVWVGGEWFWGLRKRKEELMAKRDAEYKPKSRHD
jgi:hypothetical protein